MAESAVNISSIHHTKPTIFELVAQESLIDHIHPAIKGLCSYAANKNKTIFGPLLKWYDEVFLGVNFVLQYYYLKAFDSSFSEAFYGLKRINAYAENGKIKLSPKRFYASLFFISVIPYLTRKLRKLTMDNENDINNQENNQKLRTLIKLNKLLNTSYGALRLYYLLSYAAGLARVHDPTLKMSGVELIHQDREMPSWRDTWKALFSSKVQTPKVRFTLLLKLIASTLEMGAFFVQFLNWWHSDQSKVKMTSLPIPKPPHINTGTVQCPICLKRRKNEVVLLTSGFVFCYSCISEYLNNKGKCPITNLPSNVDNLVKIY